MIIYFAGGENSQWIRAIYEGGGRSALFSYYHLSLDGSRKDREIRRADGKMKNIFIDSGAFSAFTKNVQIDIQEYCDYLIRNREKIALYANLDVIGDWRGSLKNLRTMEDRGLKPLPVFHTGEPWSVLTDLVNEYDYIALGGMVPLSRQEGALTRFLDNCFSRIGPGKKVHGFGMTQADNLKRYPFYSVDSTSWLSGTKHGIIFTFDNIGGMRQSGTTDEHDDYALLHYSDSGDKRWYQRVVRNVQEWVRFETWVSLLWSKRGIRWA
jgi:hypothetical protein